MKEEHLGDTGANYKAEVVRSGEYSCRTARQAMNTRRGEPNGTASQTGDLEAVILRVFDNLMPQILALFQGDTALPEQVSTGGVTPGDAPPSTPSSSTESAAYSSVAGRRVGTNLTMTLEMLEPFDPNDKDADIDHWLLTMDRLGDVYGWTAVERSYFTQVKLRGEARVWFNRLENIDRSWEEWKEALRRAFSKKDFAVRVHELLERRKVPTETMSRYYHAKVKLCEACKFKGEDAVSLIIDGLPEELQALAQATKCVTPEALYTEFLTSQENYQPPTWR